MNATDTLNPEVQHYKDCKIQPIDYITANNMNFLEGNIIKYVSRYKTKGGLDDLKKAKNYLDWLIDSVEAEEKGSTWKKEAMDALHKTMVDFGIPKASKDAKKIAKRKKQQRKEYKKLCEEFTVTCFHHAIRELNSDNGVWDYSIRFDDPAAQYIQKIENKIRKITNWV